MTNLLLTPGPLNPVRVHSNPVRSKAGVDGNRTHQTSLRRSTGFEDRDGHQSRIHSRKPNPVRAGPRHADHSLERALQDSADEPVFILRPHRAQIKERATILHSGEHSRTA